MILSSATIGITLRAGHHSLFMRKQKPPLQKVLIGHKAIYEMYSGHTCPKKEGTPENGRMTGHYEGVQ